MINQVNSSQRANLVSVTQKTNKAAAESTVRSQELIQSPKVDTIQFSRKQDTSVTYSNLAASKKLDTKQISALKEEADKATENLRKLVEQMILKQGKNSEKTKEIQSDQSTTIPSISIEDVNQAKLAISEDGEFGVKAVSDRLVDFAISVSGGDKSKLNELISAIDQGFASAKEALGGELPDISTQTYDETMRKLNDWASKTD